MNKEEQNPMDPMKKWIREAGTDTLGTEFHLSVLKKIEALPRTNSRYEPVISALGWRLILIFISGIFGGSLIFLPSNPSEISVFEKILSTKFPSLSYDLYNFRFPLIELSPPFLMGIVTFFILGFIMIVGTIRNKQAGI